MPTNSEDMFVRCKACGKDQGTSVTIRVPQGARGERMLGRIKWALGLVKCDECQDSSSGR